MDRIYAAIKNRDVLRQYYVLSDDFQRELIRKSIHMLIALVPALASISKGMTLALLGSGTLVYAYTETIRLSGRSVFLISSITNLSQRQRDVGRFVLGPITLGIGAMTALLLYPEPAVSIAIYALAFGDSAASIVGKKLGKIRMPHTGGKTLEGSLACFVTVFLIAYRFTSNTLQASIIALTATVFELFPGRDLDNIILPVGTGFIASQIIF